jgi:hypothetical protein
MNVIKTLFIAALFITGNLLFAQMDIEEKKNETQTITIDGKKCEVEIDKKTGAVNWLNGLKCDRLTEENVRSKSKEFLSKHTDLLKVKVNDLELTDCYKSIASDNWIISYRQLHKGVPVYTSKIDYVVDDDGNVLSLGSDIHPDILIDVIPYVSEKAALEAAKNELIALAREDKNEIIPDSIEIRKKPELVILPVKKGNGYEYELVYHIELDYDKSSHLYCQGYFMDAKSGKLVKQFLNMESGTSGNVMCGYWPANHNDPVKYTGWARGEVILLNQAKNSRKQMTTSASGDYYSNTFTADFVASAYQPPYNKCVKILGNTYGEINYSSTEFNWNWGACDATNVYYHVSMAYLLFRKFTNKMDYQMVASLKQDKSLAAMAYGTKISFGTMDGYYWARAADVIYHEYTHNAIYAIYGVLLGTCGDEGGILDEGLADYYAGSITGDPLCGESVGQNRTLKNSYTVTSSKDKYYNGQALGGACWDIRAKLGKEYTDKLVYKALEMKPYTLSKFATSIAIADDNDANLDNGTPNLSVFRTAFKRHGISFSDSRLAKIDEKEISLTETLYPEQYSLSSNCPNPFNPTTTIPFSVPEESYVKIVVYDVLGRAVATLTEDNYNAGYHSVKFNAKSDLASGIYIITATMNSLTNQNKKHIFSNKTMLIK